MRTVAKTFAGPQTLALKPLEYRLRIRPSIVDACIGRPDAEGLSLVDRPVGVGVVLAQERHQVFVRSCVKFGVRTGTPSWCCRSEDIRSFCCVASISRSGRARHATPPPPPPEFQVKTRRLANLREHGDRVWVGQERQGSIVIQVHHFRTVEESSRFPDSGAERCFGSVWSAQVDRVLLRRAAREAH